jgi:hypothetical protein
MPDFAPMNDLKDLRPRRETLRFALRNDPLLILLVFRLVEFQNETAAQLTPASELARRKPN